MRRTILSMLNLVLGSLILVVHITLLIAAGRNFSGALAGFAFGWATPMLLAGLLNIMAGIFTRRGKSLWWSGIILAITVPVLAIDAIYLGIYSVLWMTVQ